MIFGKDDTFFQELGTDLFCCEVFVDLENLIVRANLCAGKISSFMAEMGPVACIRHFSDEHQV
jgi:hypothetical protein